MADLRIAVSCNGILGSSDRSSFDKVYPWLELAKIVGAKVLELETSSQLAVVPIGANW